jgi:hypothetical protein
MASLTFATHRALGLNIRIFWKSVRQNQELLGSNRNASQNRYIRLIALCSTPSLLHSAHLFIRNLFQCPLHTCTPMDQLGGYPLQLFSSVLNSPQLYGAPTSPADRTGTLQMAPCLFRLHLLRILRIRGGGAEELSHGIFIRQQPAAHLQPRHHQNEQFPQHVHRQLRARLQEGHGHARLLQRRHFRAGQPRRPARDHGGAQGLLSVFRVRVQSDLGRVHL